MICCDAARDRSRGVAMRCYCARSSPPPAVSLVCVFGYKHKVGMLLFMGEGVCVMRLGIAGVGDTVWVIECQRNIPNPSPSTPRRKGYEKSTCANGLAGVQDGNVCCAEKCNLQCGGEGCDSIAGTNGASDCCSATILAYGVACGDMAPCIMLPDNYLNDIPSPADTPFLVLDMPAVPPSATFSKMVFTSSPTSSPTFRGAEIGESGRCLRIGGLWLFICWRVDSCLVSPNQAYVALQPIPRTKRRILCSSSPILFE